MTRPPLIPRLLMRMLLPERVHEQVAGDLDEAWRGTPDRRRYWHLALRSIVDARVCRPEPTPSFAGDNPMHGIRHDLRYAARTMTRSPGFAAAAVATLALGIGLNTAVFGIINVLAVKPLPYLDPTRVVFVLGTDAESGAIRFSMRVAEYVDIRRGLRSLGEVSAYTYLSANLTGGDVPERVQAYQVTPNTFSLLRAAPALGRTFIPSDGEPGASPVVILSDGLWRRRFGADPSIVGRSVVVNGRTHQVAGVMPPEFEYPVFNFKGDAWLPWTLDESAAVADRAGSGSATIVGRLAEGSTIEQAEAELRTLLHRLALEHPASNRALGGRVIEIGRLDDEQAGPAMALALAAVGLVLLLACANVANLLLARGVARSRELAVRAAVGATRWRIARQLLVESLLLACAGAILGGFIAAGALRMLGAVLPEMLLTTVPNIARLGIDWRVLMFTIGLAGASTILAGVLPAWRAARPAVQDGLKEGAATGGSRETRRLRSALVVAEIALATLLVVGAALLVRSHAALSRIDPGFSPSGVLTAAISLPGERYPDPAARARFYDDLAERLASVAGVEAVGLVNVLPFSTYERRTRFVVEGGDTAAPGEESVAASRIASPGYVQAMRIPLLSGRGFESGDRAGAAPVALVNQAFARRYLPGDPIGRRLRLGSLDGATAWTTVVGVIGDIKHTQLTGAPDPEVYVPLAQASATSLMMVAVRTPGDASALVPAVRREVLAVDPVQPIYHVKPLDAMVHESRLASTASAWLMGIFGGVALILAMIGVFSIVSYSVAQQMPELGLRLALGATPAGLARQVVREGAALVLTGISLGVTCAYLLSTGLRTLVYEVTPTDPRSYAFAAALLAALGVLACLIPARRAASAGPLTALRRD